jgi:predicted nucleic acid-binding protein
METMLRPIIADSSGIISVLVDTDSNHSAAIDISQLLMQRNQRIVIPSEIFSETVNILGKKYGHTVAANILEDLALYTVFAIEPSTDISRREALDLFRVAASGVSYTDCLVMAVADQHGTKTVFGFDTIFQQRGYIPPKA